MPSCDLCGLEVDECERYETEDGIGYLCISCKEGRTSDSHPCFECEHHDKPFDGSVIQPCGAFHNQCINGICVNFKRKEAE